MQSRLTALLTQWDAEKGYGFLTLKQKDIFLHRKDCAPGFKRLETGDLIQFSPGQDPLGRPCAKNAVPVQVKETGHAVPIRATSNAEFGNNRLRGSGSFRRDHAVLLICLIVAPALALYKLALHSGVTVISAVGISVITYLLYALDKTSAVSGAWRISENTLHFFSLIGGWPGAFVAQRRLRHKTVKTSFQIFFWFTVLTWQLGAIDYLLRWKMARFLWQFVAWR